MLNYGVNKAVKMRTRTEAKISLFEYIEIFYNRGNTQLWVTNHRMSMNNQQTKSQHDFSKYPSLIIGNVYEKESK